MALLSADSFNRANGAIGSTDGAGSLDPIAWQVLSGTVTITTNRAAASSTAQAVVQLSTADVDINVTLNAASGCALIFRVVDSSNFWAWYTAGTSSFLFRNVANSFTQIGATQTGATPGGDVMRIVANGTAISVYRNGVLKLSTTDSQFLTATKHGIYFSTNDSVDNWSASALATTTTVTGTQATETDTANA